ncbi:hypothetical protein BDB01DRAFT_894230 [Pilobolus umbonatus]|nr:hypothetical protein BDB01DRAFT_894230 [Pilobolus umbonatus]
MTLPTEPSGKTASSSLDRWFLISSHGVNTLTVLFPSHFMAPKRYIKGFCYNQRWHNRMSSLAHHVQTTLNKWYSTVSAPTHHYQSAFIYTIMDGTGDPLMSDSVSLCGLTESNKLVF